jgi:hypothetical protein
MKLGSGGFLQATEMGAGRFCGEGATLLGFFLSVPPLPFISG